MDHEQATLINRDTPEPLPKDGLSLFFAKWSKFLLVALIVAVVLVGVFAALLVEIIDNSDDNNNGGVGGLVVGCGLSFEPATTTQLAAMRKGLRERLLSPGVWQAAGGGSEGVILVVGLDMSYRNDVELEFFQDPVFFYLTGVDQPGFSATIDIASGNTTLFMPVLDSSYAIWSGKIPSPDDIKAQYGVNQALYSNQLEEALFNMTQEANLTVYTTGAVVDQKSFLANYTVNTTVLSRAINSERPIKSSEEIVLLEIASNVSAAAHMKVMQSVKSGIYEYNVDALFVSLCYACDLAHQAYLPIVGAGEASATLHYIIKNSLLEEGQILLIDAGGQYKGYSSDITRTYPVNGVWTEDQILIYQTVLNIQTKGIELMQPGASFLQLRTDLNTYFAQQLLDAGLVQGSLESLVSASIWSYFMPHGYSHHVGLDVHDPGSLTILQPGYVLTMEPGIYFIEPLILPALDNSTVSPYLVKDKIMHFLDSKFGGVRIEDVVLITEEGNRVLSTGVPKSIDEIKRIMQGL